MSNYPSISFSELIKIVERMSFIRIRQAGSHIRYIHPDGRKTTIAGHGNKNVPKGLLIKIIKYDLMVAVDMFYKYRNEL
jgi:predicted RNA binding protein YcfA (HicA-like mRNA interferase family)